MWHKWIPLWMGFDQENFGLQQLGGAVETFFQFLLTFSEESVKFCARLTSTIFIHKIYHLLLHPKWRCPKIDLFQIHDLRCGKGAEKLPRIWKKIEYFALFLKENIFYVLNLTEYKQQIVSYYRCSELFRANYLVTGQPLIL